MQVALTIAGSDSGGGAGIQADLKTFHAYGVFGTSAITAITVQNTLGVTAVHALPPELVRAQIEAVASDLHPAACKSGMLATRRLVQTVAEVLAAEALPNYILDPVMVATSGDRLLTADAVADVRDRLVPLATLVTPNLPEAALLVGHSVHDPTTMERAARDLVARGARAALVKGGHLAGDELLDVLYDGTSLHHWRRERVPSHHTHGTGCTLSAAITAGLALGWPLRGALDSALDLVHRAIIQAPGLGSGNGPLNHFLLPHSPEPPDVPSPGSLPGSP